LTPFLGTLCFPGFRPIGAWEARGIVVYRRLIWLLVILLVPLLGCREITVHPAQEFHLLDASKASLSTGSTLSPRTMQTLRRLDLDASYSENPRECFQRLQEQTERDPQPDSIFALAELSYSLAEQARRAAEPDACHFYYLCAGYAYHYLFANLAGASAGAFCFADPSAHDFGRDDTGGLFDPRFRLACDLYNAALARCIRTAQQHGRLDARQQLVLQTPENKAFDLTIQHHGFAWGPDEFGPLLFCVDYQVEGLPNQYHRYGLGVPLIGTRTSSKPTAKHGFYPDAVNFPVSAFFRFDGTLADLNHQQAGVLELYNPLSIANVTIDGKSVPLEADLTTPLAYFLSRSELQCAELGGFLRPDAVAPYAGIYMLEPYQPGKIPVVMIHGLLSSPLAWAPMFNDLRADPEIRKHFQFWFYLYPTGDSYLQAAADLRQDLDLLRATFDPHKDDRTMDQTVLVGHSMGGLVSRLLTVDSGDDFWRLVSREPLGELSVQSEARDELERLFYFRKQPGVRRVIYLATPHRGSNLSPSWPGRLAADLVHAPRVLVESAQQVIKADPADADQLQNEHLANSVDLLAPGAPALQLLASRPPPADVRFHSIIGRALPHTLLREVTRPFVGNEESDGVVPYSSAHLDGVDSEIIVPADHMHVHHHSLAVREVRRILLEHLKDSRISPENVDARK
jgi:pimeloyl-ACP methyl ester carboxylesterase